MYLTPTLTCARRHIPPWRDPGVVRAGGSGADHTIGVCDRCRPSGMPGWLRCLEVVRLAEHSSSRGGLLVAMATLAD